MVADVQMDLRKAAILLVSLDQEAACQIIAKFDKETVERVSLEIARLDSVGSSEKDAVLEEFYRLGMARTIIDRVGIGYASELLERSLGAEEAKQIIEQVRLSIQSAPFGFLKKTSPDALATFLAEEHPQTIALVLAHLLPRQASNLLNSLPQEKQVEVTRRIAAMEQTSPEVIREVEAALQKRLASVLTDDLQQVGGAEAVAEILNLTDRSTEKAILERLENDDPDLVEQVRKMMFVFENIALVDQRGLQEVLKEVQGDTLSLALKGASEDLKAKFFNAMSERAAALIKENMEFLGPVRLSDVERAQQEIVEVVRRLADVGTINVRDRADKEQYIQ